MTEILTESFCERCGTRYTFESARPRLRMKGVKTVSRGLKNFVLSDGLAMDEAMASARAETDRELTSYQLDAFHKTFNFCMQCRQYTCPNCWNEAEARCLTCAPHLGREILPAPFPDLVATQAVSIEDPTGGGAIRVDGNGNGTYTAPVEVEPAAEGEFDIAARLDALTVAPAAAVEVVEVVADPVDAEASIEPAAVADQDLAAIADEQHDAPGLATLAAATTLFDHETEPVADAAVEEESSVETAVVAEQDPEIAAEAETPSAAGDQDGRLHDLFRRFRPGQDIDRSLDVAEPEVEPEVATAAAVVAAEPEAMESVVAEPEPAAADAQADEQDAAPLAGLAAAAVLIGHQGDNAADAPVVPAKQSGKSRGIFRRFRPGQDIDKELDAYEREQAAAAAAAAAVVIAAEPETQPVEAVAAEAEPVEAIAAEVELEAVAVEAEPVEAQVEAEALVAAAVASESTEPEEVAEPEAVVAAGPEPEAVGAIAESDAVAVETEAEHIEAIAEPDAVTAEIEPEPAIVGPEEAAEPEAVAAAEPEPIASVVEPEEAAEPEAVVTAEPEPIAAVVEPEEAAEPEAVVAAEPELVAAIADPEEVAEPEAIVAAIIAAEVVDEIVEPEPEPVAAAEPEPVAAAAAEPEPVAAEAEQVAAAEPEPEPEPVAAATEAAPPANDVVAQPTWRMVAPDPAPDSSEPATAPSLPAAATVADPSAEPQWPSRPAWLSNAPSVGLPFLNRPASPQGGVDALWAESNRAVVDQRSPAKPASAVKPCVSCGLSLSASARFCRRCGTAQG